jgi:hypothetical protein
MELENTLSSAILDIAKGMYELVIQHKIPETIMFCHPEIICEVRGRGNSNIDLSGTYKGKERFTDFLVNIQKLYDFADFSPDEYFVSADGKALTVKGHDVGKFLDNNVMFISDWLHLSKCTDNGELIYFGIFAYQQYGKSCS